jgi:predicted NUDIX family NTP pyrophosphohydrolase
MTRRSAGLLAFRRCGDGVEVLLVHPGGPFWASRDAGAWSIPKGLVDPDEDELAAARREFAEETGFPVEGTFVDLGELQQPSGKVVHAWAVETDLDATLVRSNTFAMEWPPRSGRTAEFPEVDRGGWFPLDQAGAKIHGGQSGFLTRLVTFLESSETDRD